MLEKPPVLTETQIAEKIRQNEIRESEARARLDAFDRELGQRLRGIPKARYQAAVAKPWAGGFIWGKPGRGKTHEAICRLLSTTRGVFVTAPELVELARQIELDRADDFEESRWKAIRRASHLVLDDLGVRRSTPFAVDAIYGVIDLRWRENAETLVTSNLSLAELATSLDGRCVSRILGFGLVTEITGADRRWNTVY